MSFPVRAITLDLDDTLWPIGPAINRAEEQLDAWMKAHAPRSFARWPQAKRRKLREQVDLERPHLSHDMTVQRQWMLERMLAEAGDDIALMPAAYEAYFAGRCDVKHYGDSVPALDRLAARVPLAAISNGNADLSLCGIDQYFEMSLAAREAGMLPGDIVLAVNGTLALLWIWMKGQYGTGIYTMENHSGPQRSGEGTPQLKVIFNAVLTPGQLGPT